MKFQPTQKFLLWCKQDLLKHIVMMKYVIHFIQNYAREGFFLIAQQRWH